MRAWKAYTPGALSAGSVLSLLISLTFGPPVARAQFLEPEVRVLATLLAESPGDAFGFVGEVIGDLDGDGASEFLIGAPNSAAGGTLSGKVFVYDGASGSLLVTHTGQPFQRLGTGVAGGQDLNHDGTPDYVLGGQATFGGPGPQHGRVVAVSGRDHTILFDILDPEDRSFLGYDVNLAGDLDGDGHADVVAGAPLAASGAGRVSVFSGADGSVLWTREGANAGDFFGTAVSGLDDLNGDGVAEQGVGAVGGVEPGGEATGLAFVLSGDDGRILRTLTPAPTGASFGDFFVHDAGDVDDDGTGDILVGDFSDSGLGAGSGRAYLFPGALPKDDEEEDHEDRMLPFALEAEGPGDGFGIGRGIGDVDGDDHDDLFLAAFTSSAGAPQGGKGFVFSGRTGTVLRTMTGTVPGALLGFDALGLGDVNGDGLVDYLITGADIAHVVAGIEHGDDDDDEEGDEDDDDDDEEGDDDD